MKKNYRKETQDYLESLGRRKFIIKGAKAAGAAALGTTLGSLVSSCSLDGETAKVDSKLHPNPHNIDDIAKDDTYGIRDLINDARTKPVSEYKNAYQMFEQAANSARAGYSGSDAGNQRAKTYRGLEIVAKMWQAYFLNVSGQLLPTEDEVFINRLGRIKRDSNTNQGMYAFNLFSALSNYDSVERLLQEAKHANITFDNKPVVEGMDGWGKVARPMHLYTRKLETIDKLLRNFDKVNKEALLQKKYEIYQKVMALADSNLLSRQEMSQAQFVLRHYH